MVKVMTRHHKVGPLLNALWNHIPLLQGRTFLLEFGVEVFLCISQNPKKEIKKEVSVFLSKIRS